MPSQHQHLAKPADAPLVKEIGQHVYLWTGIFLPVWGLGLTAPSMDGFILRTTVLTQIHFSDIEEPWRLIRTTKFNDRWLSMYFSTQNHSRGRCRTLHYYLDHSFVPAARRPFFQLT